MKKILYPTLLIFFFLSCEDVIDVDVPVSEPKLVIEANFNIYMDGEDIGDRAVIKLSLSAPYLNGEIKGVNGALVYVTDIENGEIHNFKDNDSSGLYYPDNQNFTLKLNTAYELTVVYKNETYKSSTISVPTVPIDKISQGDGTLFGGDETEIIIEFTDDASRDDFYLFDLDFNLFLTTDDRFYQGEKFVFSYFYDDLQPNQEITIEINGIDEQFFNYMTLLIEQSGQDAGGPFQAPPATVRGNIVNTTKPENYPLGYFSISESDRASFTVQ